LEFAFGIAFGYIRTRRPADVAYELFKRVAVRVDTPALSIRAGGTIAINAAACRVLLEAGIKTVVILWDKATNRMAIKAAPKGEKNSFTITFSGRHSASFRAKSFLRHVGWNASKSEALATTWNAAEKMFEVSLPAKYIGAASARQVAESIVKGRSRT
jgi:hypothetical protein